MSEWKENIIRLLVFIAAVIICSFIISFFQKKPKEDKYFQMVIALKDSINIGLKRELQQERSHKDEIITLLKQKDTVLIREYKTNTVRYDKVPATVNAIPADDFIRAVNNY